MIIELNEKESVNLTFSEGSVKVAVYGGDYLVKWYSEDEQIGEMMVKDFHWGAYPHNDLINEWSIELWKPDGSEMVLRQKLSIPNANILIIFNFQNPMGKIPIYPIIDYCRSIMERGANPYVFFHGSESFDLERYGITPLRFNQDMSIGFSHIIEKDIDGSVY